MGFRDPAIPLQATDAPEQPSKKRHRILWGFLYVGIFIAVFTLSAAIKLVSNPREQQGSRPHRQSLHLERILAYDFLH